MTRLYQAILPGWTGTPLRLPWSARMGLRISLVLAHLLCWLWFFRPLSSGAPLLLERMAHHRLWPLRALVQWWKLDAMVSRC